VSQKGTVARDMARISWAEKIDGNCLGIRFRVFVGILPLFLAQFFDRKLDPKVNCVKCHRSRGFLSTV
jgi:hypothetical protein